MKIFFQNKTKADQDSESRPSINYFLYTYLTFLQVSEVPPRANKKYLTSPPPPVTLPATALEGAFGAAGASSSASGSSMKPSIQDFNLIESNAAAHVVNANAKEKSNQVFLFE